MSNPFEQYPSPNYKTPPVVETILGMQFARLEGMSNAYLGAFWKALDGKEWPHVADVPLLQSQYERFTKSAMWGKGIAFQFSQDLSTRLQIKNKSNDRMIQVQNSRLHLNWLGQGGRNYPRYESVREEFHDIADRFITFVDESEQVGSFKPNQWEVTYINHFPQGTVWNTPKDWGFFTPLTAVPTLEGLIQGESFGGEWHFTIPEQQGRLHIQWQHGRTDNEKETIVLTLTARGPLHENGSEAVPLQSVMTGLDLGHDVIVRSFAALMSNSANTYWGLESDATS